MLNPMKNDHRKPSVQQEIDDNLKKVYEQALQEDIPDRFRDLLAQLRDREMKERSE